MAVNVKQEKTEETSLYKEELHHSHQFVWKHEAGSFTLQCMEAGTVYQSLQRSEQFMRIHKHDKELLILHDGKAICEHFPCHLISQELIIKYIKAATGTTRRVSKNVPPSEEIVTFHIVTVGARGIQMVMHNNELKIEVPQVTVYGYRGQTVKQALEQDGRFGDAIFQKVCVLHETKSSLNTEMSSLVDYVEGKLFRIKSLSGKNVAELPPETPQKQPSGAKHDSPPPSTSNESARTEIQRQEPAGPSSSVSTNSKYQPIPNTGEVLNLLRSQFKGLVAQLKNRETHLKIGDEEFFRQAYAKTNKTCLEVRRVKKLMERSNSVCQVRIDGDADGTGFLLFDRYILTNGHVVIQEGDQRPKRNITIQFSFESLEGNHQSIEVEVIAFELVNGPNSKCNRDWALLKLCSDPNDPNVVGLLKHYGLVSQTGPICLIGHPNGEVKQIDPCVTIPCEKREETMSKYVPYITGNYFSKEIQNNRQIQTYDTCFYEGSSGSPVFDDYCNVVAMHSGGFCVKQNKTRMIDFAHPLSLIMEQIIIELVKKDLTDVLEDLIDFGIPDEVAKTVKSGKIREFVHKTPISEKVFFFFSQIEESIPMDIE